MCLAVPGKIVSVHEKDPLFRLGVVDFGGVTREVNLACVPEAIIPFSSITKQGREELLEAIDALFNPEEPESE